MGAGDKKTYPENGNTLTMHYVGKFHGGAKHGEVFGSSRQRNKPFTFDIGKGRVIKGWDAGVIQMSKGEKAELHIGWDYGYGADGYGPIPAKQDLLFEVELLDIEDAKAEEAQGC